MDIVVIVDPSSTTGERLLGVISLGANVLTAGLLPNFGMSVRAARLAGSVGHALRSFRTARWVFGSANFILDSRAMRHILERHHPTWWDGSISTVQTFFSPRLTPDDIADIAGEVMRQNRAALVDIGPGFGRIAGWVDGVEYSISVSGGRIVQMFPRLPSP